MSQLREQTQDNEPEEDTKGDSKEDLSENSKEDLSEDSKEDLSEDSKEDLSEDSKEDLDEVSKEDLNEDSNEDLDEVQPFEPDHSDVRVFDPNLGDVRVNIDPNLSDLSSLDPDTNEGKEPINLDLSDVRVNIDPNLSDLGSLDPDTSEGKEPINLDLSDARVNFDPSLSDLGSLDPDTKEGISTEPIDLDLSDARVNIDPSLSDLGSLDPDTNEVKELIDLDLSDARVNIDPSLSDLGSLDPETNDVKELIDLDLSDARVNIDSSLSDLGSLDPDTKEGISPEPIELDHSDINPYIDDNEGTTTSLLIKHDEESNRMSELNVRLSDMDSELASELPGDSDVQDIARDELSGLDAALPEMDDICSSEFQEVPVIQDVLKDELSELDGELSELEDISSYELKETPVIQDMLEDELSELDRKLSEIDDIISSELQEAPIIQELLEVELSELDGELSEIKDISSSDFQDSKITQDIAREEIKEELMELDNESWNIKDMFLNEFVDLSDTQYSLEEDSLEISNVIEPMALDITNVHNKTLGQDYIRESQIENVYKEGEENEINHDLSIDKNNNKTENEKVGDKSKNKDLTQDASEQELSAVENNNGKESNKISADASSSDSQTAQDNTNEGNKETEQTSEIEKESEREGESEKGSKLISEIDDLKDKNNKLKKKETHQELNRDKNQPYGFIYLAINFKNGKVWVGQTVRKRWKKNKIPIEERWKEHIQEAKRTKFGQQRPISSLLNKAINKYGAKAFKLKQIDTAQNQKELDKKEKYWIKKYDSMNSKKGYNMTEGGQGGEMRPEIIDKLRKISEEFWKNPKYINKQKLAKEDPEYIKIQSRKARKNWRDPKYIKLMNEIKKTPEYKKKRSDASLNLWKDPKYAHKVSKGVSHGVKKKWTDLRYYLLQLKRIENSKKKIKDIKEFLNDIKNKMTTKDLAQKYKMSDTVLQKKIKEIFRQIGPKNVSEARKYLQDKDINKILKDIEKDPIKEILNDIKNQMKVSDMLKKYKIGPQTLHKKIKEIFGPYGPENVKEAREYLQDKDINMILKDFEKKTMIKILNDIKNQMKVNDILKKYKITLQTLYKKLNEIYDPNGPENIEEVIKLFQDKNTNKRFIKEILNDIQSQMKVNKILKKYRISSKTLYKRIKETFGQNGLKTVSEVREYLQNKDIIEILNDIKNQMKVSDILKKYKISSSAFYRRIREIFGPNGPKNISEVRKYLQNKDINEILRDIKKKKKKKDEK